jgi:ABC-type sugar transport system ATPase subunit
MKIATGIRCTGLTRRFGEVTALDKLDLEILPGEFMALLGPSGSGKSTLLNLLAGLLVPDDGEIHIGERRVDHLAPNQRNVAMVFQSYALYPHMTVFENLAFPLKANRRANPPGEIDQRVQAVSAKLGLDQLLHRYPKELSGGQQQRVALGRGLIREPMVFLLDEPLSNLDARLRIRMRTDIKRLHNDLASTIVYVTHDQSEAMALADRIAVFDGGRLQQVGTPGEVYGTPATLFVANFVGDREINLLDCTVRQDVSGTILEANSVRLAIPDLAAADGTEVVVGIRPEALVLTDDAATDLAGVVQLTELIGPDLYAHVEIGGVGDEHGVRSTGPNGVGTVVARLEPGSGVTRGVHVRFAVDRSGMHVFDRVSGARVPSAGRL